MSTPHPASGTAPVRVGVLGARGKVGTEVCRAVGSAPDTELVAEVDAGRLVVRQIDLATLRVPVKRLNKVFAFNVNLFWVRPCEDEIALLHERVVPGGAVYLFYEAARPELVPNIVKKASENLLRGGFRVSVVEQKAPPVIGIIAKR